MLLPFDGEIKILKLKMAGHMTRVTIDPI